jgi:hypothetical protein
MIYLNDHQTNVVRMVIEERGLNYGALKEELVDHYCCLVESHMQDGFDFEESLKMCVAEFASTDLKNIEKVLINQSNKYNTMMKNFAFLTLILLIISSTLLLGQNPEMPVLRPLDPNYKISSSFGEQIHPISKKLRHHDGIDFAAPLGTPIYAPANGTILKVLHDDKYGKHLLIDHGNGFETIFAHLSDFSVKEGEKVAKGQLIGKVGNTGMSTGPHLHYEVIKDGRRINPADYMHENKT